MTSDPARENLRAAQATTDSFVSYPAAEPDFSRTQVKTAGEGPKPFEDEGAQAASPQQAGSQQAASPQAGPHAGAPRQPGTPPPPVPPVAYGAQPGRPANGKARTLTYGLAGLLAAAALVVGGSVGFIVGHSTGSTSQVPNGGPGMGGYGGPRGGMGGYGGFGQDGGNSGSDNGSTGSDNGSTGSGTGSTGSGTGSTDSGNSGTGQSTT